MSGFANAARGVYGTSKNSGVGKQLATGGGGNSFLGIEAPAASVNFKKVSPSQYSRGTIAGGTINYIRLSKLVTIEGKVTSLNGVSGADYTLTQNGTPGAEQHSSKYGRKLAITAMTITGKLTYDATNGTTYGLYPTSGTPVDKWADSAKKPYGPMPNFVTLDNANPVVHSFKSLTIN